MSLTSVELNFGFSCKLIKLISGYDEFSLLASKLTQINNNILDFSCCILYTLMYNFQFICKTTSKMVHIILDLWSRERDSVVNWFYMVSLARFAWFHTQCLQKRSCFGSTRKSCICPVTWLVVLPLPIETWNWLEWLSLFLWS